MTDFIVKLENMLKASGYNDWEIIHAPEHHGYILKLDGDAVFMMKITKEEEND